MRATNVVLCVLLGACAEAGHSHDHDHDHDSDPAASTGAYTDGMTAMTQPGGHMAVALTLSGGATVGTHDVTLVIDHHGAAEAGLDVSLDATMPDHGHGTNAVTVIDGPTAGSYTAEGLELTMPGTWEITVSIDDGDHGGDAVFAFDVTE